MVGPTEKKIFSCVVSYKNPEHLDKALQAQRQMKVPAGYRLDVVVIDNSADASYTPKIQAVCKRHQCQSIFLNENLGVSGAYAHCTPTIVHEGYEFMWLWDQDSLPPDNCLSELLKSFESESKKQSDLKQFSDDRAKLAPLGMVGPKLMDPACIDEFFVFFNPPYNLNLMNKRRFPLEKVESGEIETTYLVNSGCLIHRDVITAVGGPDTDFFMDLVDFEYSSKVVSAGFRLVINANTVVKHKVGSPRPFRVMGRTLFGRDYPPFRYYYQARNDILLSRMGEISAFQRAAMIWRVFIRGLRIFLTEDRSPKKLAANYLGWWHGLLGRRGHTHAGWMLRR